MSRPRYVWVGKCQAGHTAHLYSVDPQTLPALANPLCDQILRDPPETGRATSLCGKKQTWALKGRV